MIENENAIDTSESKFIHIILKPLHSLIVTKRLSAPESALSIQKLNSNSTLDSSCYTARELTTISSKIPIFTENKTITE